MPRENSFSEIFGDEFQEETKTPEELVLEKEEEEARAKRHKEAAARYEAGIGKKPVKVETGEDVGHYLGEKIEEEAEKRTRDKTQILWGERKQRGPSRGAPRFDEAQGVVIREVRSPGERSARKPRKLRREAARKEMRKEAA